MAVGWGELGRVAAPAQPGRSWSIAARIALWYAAAGALWIAFSDRVLAALVGTGARLTAWQTAKGWFFVGITALLLGLLVQRYVTGVHRAQERLAATVGGMAEAVFTLSAAGELREVNRAGLEMLGLADAAAVRRPLAELVGRLQLRDLEGRPIPVEDTPEARALRGEATGGRVLIARHASGADLWVSVTAAPVRDAAGRVELAVSVVHDISELRQFERLRDEFVSNAAHELKTPIATVQGYVQLLRTWAGSGRDEREARALEVLERQCGRIDRLVQAMLGASRAALGTLELRRERLDLGELAAEVVAQARAIAPRHRLVVECGTAAPVEADRERVRQVLVNLIDNAVRFSPEGGEVRTTVRRAGADAVVEVRDEGLGVPAERQGGLFTPYFRAHAGTPHDHGGLGLGLHLSREIVARHGGAMRFESAEGRGSSFGFTLPLAPEAVDAA
ncbi:MAG TPA: ATP-binding protein [Polyangia bacterium]|jgi:PAS domain S-box-containing protein